MAAAGCRIEDIARVCGVARITFDKMRRGRDPLCEAAFERGYAKFHDTLIEDLRAASAKGSFVASIFLLRSRFGYQQDTPADDVNPTKLAERLREAQREMDAASGDGPTKKE